MLSSQTGKSLGLLLLVTLITPITAMSQTLPRWELGAGMTLFNIPHYRGSDASDTYLIPYPYFIYRGDRINVNEGGIQGKLFRSDNVKLDLSAAAGPGVTAHPNGPRAGMPQLAFVGELGPSLGMRLWRDGAARQVWFHAPLRAAFSIGATSAGNGVRHQGWVFSPYIEYVSRTFGDRRWKHSVAFGPIFADDNYNGYYYNVDPAYQTVGRPAYQAGGGYNGSRVTLFLNHQLGKKVWAGAWLRADSLSGAGFTDSPLVETKRYLMTGVAITWVFAESSERTKVE